MSSGDRKVFGTGKVVKSLDMKKTTGRDSQIIGAVGLGDQKVLNNMVIRTPRFEIVQEHIFEMDFGKMSAAPRKPPTYYETHPHLEYPDKDNALDKVLPQARKPDFGKGPHRDKHYLTFSTQAYIAKRGDKKRRKMGLKLDLMPFEYLDHESTMLHDPKKHKADRHGCRAVRDFGKGGRDDVIICSAVAMGQKGGDISCLDPYNTMKRGQAPCGVDMRKGTERAPKVKSPCKTDFYDRHRYERNERYRKLHSGQKWHNMTGRDATKHLGLHEFHDVDYRVQKKYPVQSPDMRCARVGRYGRVSVVDQVKSSVVLMSQVDKAIAMIEKYK